MAAKLKLQHRFRKTGLFRINTEIFREHDYETQDDSGNLEIEDIPQGTHTATQHNAEDHIEEELENQIEGQHDELNNYVSPDSSFNVAGPSRQLPPVSKSSPVRQKPKKRKASSPYKADMVNKQKKN